MEILFSTPSKHLVQIALKLLASIFVAFLFSLNLKADNLNAIAATGTNTTNSSTYVTVGSASVTIDVSNANKVLVLSTFETNRTQAATARTVYFQITDGTTSKELQRYLVGQGNIDEYGIGSLVNIYDVSATSGNVTYELKHRTDASQTVTTQGTITAISLTTTTNKITLNNDENSINSNVSTTSTTFEEVTGLATDGLLLPVTGGFLVASSINCQKTVGAGTSDAGEWKLQYRKGYSGNWEDATDAISRSMSNTSDAGIITFYTVFPDNPRDTYYFRIVHRVSVGTGVTIETMANSTIVAVALGYEGSSVGRQFTSYSQKITSSNTILTSASNVASVTGITTNGANALVIAKFGMSATGLCVPIYNISSTGTLTSQEERRTVKTSTDQGAGGIVGLVSGLSGSSGFNLQHRLTATGQTLTTSNVIFGIVDLTDKIAPGYWTGSTSTLWNLTSNWADGTIPSASTNVTIFDHTNKPVVTASPTAVCNTLNVVYDGTVTVNSGQTLTLSGDLVVESGGSFINDGTTTVTETVKATRNVSKDIWHYISSPVGGQAINATWITDNDVYSPNSGTNYNFFRWNEPTNMWIIYGDALFSDASFVNGRGYIVTFASNRILEFMGSLNSSNYTQTVYSSGISSWSGFNLIGNPFVSPIDMSLFTNATANPNIEGTVYLWSEQGGWVWPADNYAYWNGSGNIGNGTQTPSDQIAVGQSFMVKAKNHNTFVNLNSNMRVHANPNFFKQTEHPQIKLALQYADNHYNETLIAVLEDASIGFDRDYDAHKLMDGANLYMYTLMPESGEEMAIQGIPYPEDETIVIPLIIKTSVAGEFDLSVQTFENIDQKFSVTLMDKLLNKIYMLAEGNELKLNLDEGLIDSRFELQFKSTVGINETSNSSVSTRYSHQKLIIENPEQLSGFGEIFTVSGRKLMAFDLNNTNNQSVDLNYAPGYYLVTFHTDKGISTNKIFVE